MTEKKTHTSNPGSSLEDRGILRIGILGLGEGRSAISAVLGSKKMQLEMICDKSLETCRERGDEFKVYEYATEYDEMLNNEEIDIIAIYTPDHLHAEHIKQALLHNKHVVCTKPLIDNLSKAKELLELQKQTGKKVFVGQSSRFFEPYKRQRKDFDPVDFIRYYLPNIEEVMGYGMISSNGKTAGLKNEDTMHFIFKADDGRIARVSGSFTGPTQPTKRDSGMTCILRGTMGASQADYHELRYAVTTKDGEEKMITWGDAALNHYFRFEGQSHHAGEYQNYLEYFVDSIKQDFTAYPDLKEGIGTIALLQAMDKSLQTGVPVKVASILDEYGLTKLVY